jgi:transcriptional regulatory protein RtcR
MARKPLVVFSILGTTLDTGRSPQRWDRWRPTVALCQHEDLPIARLELLHGPHSTGLAAGIIEDIHSVSPTTKVRTLDFATNDAWNFEQVYGALHDIATRYAWNTEREDYLVNITTGTHVAQICLFLLTEARYFPARLVQTSPPSKGDRNDKRGRYGIIDLDLSRYDHLASRFRKEQDDSRTILKSGIATRNEAFNTMIARVESVSVGSRAPLLLLGPTGAGKSQLAKRIFAVKKARQRLEGPFVEVNCATLRGDAAMSTLFGHVKGAFTGALTDRPGLLRKAQGGVLFLDEIGELGADEQAMLLRAIEEGVFYPMGSDKEVKATFGLVAGTNRDLPRLAAAGRFRADLLARINLWTFRLPGLTERFEDLEPNLSYELDVAASTTGTRITMNREATTRYLGFATSADATWPGNFRDLNASVTRMATLAPGGRITVAIVEEEIGRLHELFSAFGSDVGGTGPSRAARLLGLERLATVDRFDLVQLEDVLGICARATSMSEAGRLLFAATRAAKTSVNDADRLRKYLARFDLTFAGVRKNLAGADSPTG